MADLFKFIVSQMLDPDKFITCGFDRADQLVELGLNRGCIAVLRILNEKHDQKGNDRRRCIDHELPRIRIAEQRSGRCPDEDEGERKNKGNRPADKARSAIGDQGENTVHCAGLSLRGDRG